VRPSEKYFKNNERFESLVWDPKVGSPSSLVHFLALSFCTPSRVRVIHSCLLGRKIMSDKDNHYLDGDKHESLSSSNLPLSGGW